MDFLSAPVGPLTVGQWIGALVVFMALSSFLGVLRRRSEAKAHSGTVSAARCLGCGWQGKVSRYHRTCPKCGNSITRLSKGEPV
jgi:predicted RNA-binding Zn-ribbon protein involved in translation (DUF1610 family)